MDDTQLLRYSRQIMLPDMDIAGQQKLLDATVALVGLGGLGSPTAMYLATAGVGSLILIDDDAVELSNLQRQIVHRDANIGLNKAESAASTLKQLAPDCDVQIRTERLQDMDSARALAREADVIVDGTDNFSTRYLLNDACLQTGTPQVSAAAIRWEGQITVFDPRNDESPCYACLYAKGSDEALNCSENGVIAPLVGVIGTMQALETIKVITGVGTTLVGWLAVFDGFSAQWHRFKLPRNPKCAACG